MAYDLNSAFAVSSLSQRISEVGKKKTRECPSRGPAPLCDLTMLFDYLHS